MKKYKLRVLKPKEVKLNIDFELDKAISFRDMIVVSAPSEVLTANFAREFMQIFKNKYPGTSLLVLPKGVEILELEEIVENKEDVVDNPNNDVGC
jgi:hypothetical protein